MKLYARVKVDGIWKMVPAGKPFQQYRAFDTCECRICRGKKA